jgi:thioredoxin-like negative regulator of GroEL
MTTAQLQQKIQDKEAILVYFQNDNCPPCMSLRPKVQTMIEQDFPKMNLTFVNSFENPELTAQFSVFAHPTLLIFFDGKEYFRASKYVSTQELSQKIERPYQMIFE